MKIDRVSYQKLFPLGVYINERIGVELSLEAGEDAKEALKTARKLVHEYHMEANKELYEKELSKVEEHPKVIHTDPKLNQEQSIIRDISTVNSLTVLESYRLIAKNNPEIQKAYDNKLQSLKK
jgi:hypothetical protein